MATPPRSLVTHGLIGLAALFVLLGAVAGWRAHTSVPVWDMWGSLDFYTALHEGAGWSAWWQQSNEHRIVLSRALFWMDYVWFGGKFAFLLVVNYLLALCNVAAFWAFLKARAEPLSRAQLLGATACLCIWLLSWVQKENLSWPFQSQFFLSQLLPLLGLYCLFRATSEDGIGRWFAAACALGVLSVGTMINGVMALPMMVLYAAVMRMGWRRVAMLAVLAAVCVTVYMQGYATPPGHPRMLDTLRQQPLGMVQYTLQYLGGPFQFFTQQLYAHLWIGQCFGVLFVALFLVKLVPALRAPRSHALDLSLLAFIIYIAGIAFATSGGRLPLGMGTALASRYTTPTLMAWAALGVLYTPQLLALRSRGKAVAAAVLIGLLAAMLAVQASDLKRNNIGHLRLTGALALTLGVKDGQRVGMLVWDFNYAKNLVDKGLRDGAGVFGQPMLVDAVGALGSHAEPLPARCAGSIDAVRTLPEDPRFVAVSGTLFPDSQTEPPSVRLAAPDGTIVGYGIPDRWRKVAATDKDQAPAHKLTFTAYLRSEAMSTTVTLIAPGTACSVPVSVSATQ
ncbi:hypothetical protein AAFF27_00695 [Xylophilus sp. GW821-FHT01B05]